MAGLAACTADAPPPANTATQQPPAAGTPEQASSPPASAPAAVAPSWRPINEVKAGAASSNCHIDNLAGVENVTTARLQKGSVLGVSGWLAVMDGTTVPSEAWVRIEDGTNGRVWEMPLTVFTPRPDVAEAAHQPGLLNSGFSVSIDTAELPAHAKHVYLAFRHDGKDYICDGGHQIILE